MFATTYTRSNKRRTGDGGTTLFVGIFIAVAHLIERASQFLNRQMWFREGALAQSF